MNATTKSIVRRLEKELSELTLEEYAETMRELSAWAEEQAGKAEYEPDYEYEEDE